MDLVDPENPKPGKPELFLEIQPNLSEILLGRRIPDVLRFLLAPLRVSAAKGRAAAASSNHPLTLSARTINLFGAAPTK